MDFSTYVRNAILSWIKGTTFPNARKIENSAGLTIGSAASTISSTHIGLWDASSGGNFIARAVAPYSFISGTSYSIAIGDLEFILD